MTTKQITLQSKKPIDEKVFDSLSVLLSELGIKIVVSEVKSKNNLLQKEKIMQKTLKIFELDENDQDGNDYDQDTVKPFVANTKNL